MFHKIILTLSWLTLHRSLRIFTPGLRHALVQTILNPVYVITMLILQFANLNAKLCISRYSHGACKVSRTRSYYTGRA